MTGAGALDNLCALRDTFHDECEAISNAARKVLGQTDVWPKIDNLCREHTTRMEILVARAAQERKPTVAVLARNGKAGHWVLNVVREKLSPQVAENTNGRDGFVAATQGGLAQASVQHAEPQTWRSGNAIACMLVAPQNAVGLHADLVLYVVRFEDIQKDTASRDCRTMAGLPVIPIVMDIPPTQDANDYMRDNDQFLARLQQAVGETTVAEVVAIPDLEHRETTLTPEEAGIRVWGAVEPHLAGLGEGRISAVERRCEALRADFRREVGLVLRESPVGELREVLEELDEQQKETLRGCTREWLAGGNDLQVPIRMRMRLLTCQVTPPTCFPFRSILGVLALTHSAWDRLALAVAGSPVAIVMTAYHSISKLRDGRRAFEALTDEAAERVGRRIITKLHDTVDATRHAIAQTLPDGEWALKGNTDEVRVQGVDAVLQRAHEILRHNCESQLPKRRIIWTARLCALAFAIILSGPLAALYADYLTPLAEVWRGHGATVTDFPALELSRLLLGVFLGGIPLAVVGMFLLTYVSRPSLTKTLQQHTVKQVDEEIDQMINAGTLQLEGLGETFREIRYLLKMIPSR